MSVDGFATFPHYAAHIRPVLDALPPPLQGQLWARHTDRAWGPQLRSNSPAAAMTVVAGVTDVQAMRGRTRLVHVDHGAGQSYGGDLRSATSGGYPGGQHPDLARVELFLTPGEGAAERWRASQPQATVVAVGCPKLDWWATQPNPDPTVIGFTYHWDCQLVPETESAWPHYQRGLEPVIRRLIDAGATVIGHVHPRAGNQAVARWRRLGVDVVVSEAEVFARAGMLVADNTSMLYEFAALGRPVVVLNQPRYRRDVDHGMRFWDLIPGPQVDDPAELAEVVEWVLAHPDQDRDLRERVSARVYARHGDAATAAATAIMEAL